MTEIPTRRRFMRISGAFGGLALLPFGAGTASASQIPITWRGMALGAPAEMILYHPDRAEAEILLHRASAEVARLERIFSLYKADSALVELNRVGALAIPPPELVDLLAICRRYWTLSDGAFDPSVQPLWTLHAQHFATPGAAVSGPTQPQVDKVLSLISFAHVSANSDRIAFARQGMAITLNGIAQGFITDHIVGMLRAAGITSTMVDMGEIRTIGARHDGTPWQVGISGESLSKIAPLAMIDRAIATSSPSGFKFAGPGSPCHLLDPRTGASASRYRSVSVCAPDATMADALSTAFSFMEPDQITALQKSLKVVDVHLVLQDGRYVAIT